MTRGCLRCCDGHHEKSDWVPSVNRFTVAPRAVRVAPVGRNGVEQLLGVFADCGDKRLPDGQFDMVMAWSVDRLGRSLQDLVGFLSELHALRIDLFLHQQGLDTTTPAGKALFQMMGVFAEFERSIIAERVRSGIKRVRSEGKRWGRPPIAPVLEKRIREALNKPGRTEGVRKIAARFGVDPSTVQRISRPFDDASIAAARRLNASLVVGTSNSGRVMSAL